LRRKNRKRKSGPLSGQIRADRTGWAIDGGDACHRRCCRHIGGRQPVDGAAAASFRGPFCRPLRVVTVAADLLTLVLGRSPSANRAHCAPERSSTIATGRAEIARRPSNLHPIYSVCWRRTRTLLRLVRYASSANTAVGPYYSQPIQFRAPHVRFRSCTIDFFIEIAVQ
jgi:hypothetical protein